MFTKADPRSSVARGPADLETGRSIGSTLGKPMTAVVRIGYLVRLHSGRQHGADDGDGPHRERLATDFHALRPSTATGGAASGSGRDAAPDATSYGCRREPVRVCVEHM
jgi:hypothetical protein